MSSSTAASALDQGSDVYGNLGGSNAPGTNWTLIAAIAAAVVVAWLFFRRNR